MEKLTIVTRSIVYGGATKTIFDIIDAACDYGIREINVLSVDMNKKVAKEFMRDTECDVSFYTLFKRHSYIPSMVKYYLIPKLISKYREKLYEADLFLTNVQYFTETLTRKLTEKGVVSSVYHYYPFKLFTSKKQLNNLRRDLRNEAVLYNDNFSCENVGCIRHFYHKIIRAMLSFSDYDNYCNVPIRITVSEWSRKMFEQVYRCSFDVLQPSIDTSRFIPERENSFDERLYDVSLVGRIVPEKRYHEILRILDNDVVKKVVIVGRVDNSSIWYMKKLYRISKENGIELTMKTNVSMKTVDYVLTHSKTYVHSMRGEHFGITVVEAMSAGVPVIVHRSGGPYYDIIDNGKYGLYYSRTDQVRYIVESLQDRKVWNKYHKLAIERSAYYDKSSFKEKFVKIIESVY